jgi:hypothetical protein
MANITITIPDEHVSRVLNAFIWTTQQDRLSYDGDFRPLLFAIDEKKQEENNLQFSKRVIIFLLLNLVKTCELNEDYERYIAAVKEVSAPNQNVPEDIVL